jgi:two-component system chemotaxis response regulator CheY
MNILVVDDSKVMRMKIKGIISAAGVPVDTFLEAAHGKEALAVFDAHPIDVVFTDINMPEMDGRELLKTLSTRTFSKPLYRVVCTTETPQQLREELKAYGVNLYIEKPFNSDAVKDLLTKVSAGSAA